MQCLALLVLTSCGDFWESEPAAMVTAQQMQLERRLVTLVEGDRYVIPVSFTPDSLHNATVYWESMDTAVVRFVDDTLHAVAQGLTQAVAFTTIDRLRDTCWVQVIGPMSYEYGRYANDMLVYASVDVRGKHLTVDNCDSLVIGAFVGDQLRGVGRMLRERDIDYMALRVESALGYGEPFTVRCYHRGQARFDQFPDTLTFTGESLGRLSSLYPLVIEAEAPSYEPSIDDLLDEPVIVVPDTLVVIDEE